MIQRFGRARISALPVLSVLAGDTTDFLHRTSKIQWALMLTVYCVSHAPALLLLRIPGFEGQNVLLLFFLLTVVQMSDVLQYVFGKLFGRRKIAPNVSPSKTWEGFLGGGLSAQQTDEESQYVSTATRCD